MLLRYFILGKLLEILNQFYRRQEVRNLAADNGLDGMLLESLAF